MEFEHGLEFRVSRRFCRLAVAVGLIEAFDARGELPERTGLSFLRREAYCGASSNDGSEVDRLVWILFFFTSSAGLSVGSPSRPTSKTA